VPLADIRPALRAYLLADNAISQAVGGVRIYPTVLPQGIKAPSIVYNVISEITDHVTTGASGLVMVRMQLDAYATTPDAADELARAVKLRIDGFSGPMPYGSNSPPDAVEVQGIFAETARSGYQPEPELYRSSRDFLIWFAER
jgi:hypothetical protein